MEEIQDDDQRYSEACYYDKEQEMWVDSQYQPVQLPGIFSPLHGGESDFDPLENAQQDARQRRFSYSYKDFKYKGNQLKDNLTIAALQVFKSEWSAHVLSSRLTEAQQTNELLSRGLAGKAKVLVSQKFGAAMATTEAKVIMDFLESKISAHLGLLGKMEMVKKVQQDIREESLVNFFLSLDAVFQSTPNKSDDQKIEAAFGAIRAQSFKMSLAKKEKKWKGNWQTFQEVANEIWGSMGGKDTESEEIIKLRQQLNFIQSQAENRERELINRIDQQQRRCDDQINVVKQNFARPSPIDQPRFFNKMICFKCGVQGHKAGTCPNANMPDQNRSKKSCSLHGDNFSHTTAQCRQLRFQQQAGARGGRPPQRVQFLNDSIDIKPVVVSNNNDSTKYNVVMDSSDARIECNIEKKSNLLSSKSSEEPANLEPAKPANEKDEKEVEEGSRFTLRRAKNVKTNSSSLFLSAALEDYYQKPIFRTKRNNEKKEPKKKRVPAKWRDSNSVNSIMDIEILKVKGRVNDLVDEQILVDTGARSNVISKEMVQKLNLLHQIVPTEIRLSTANNSSLQVLGKIELAVKWQKELAVENVSFNYASYQDQVDSINSCPQIEVGQSRQPVDRPQGQFLIDFIVVEELSVPIILGTKGIKEMNMLIDFQIERIIVDGEYYPFINARRSDELRTVKKAIVPPSCIHSIEIEGDLIQGVYSIEEACQDSPIQVIEAGFTADKGRNRFKIWVKNLSKEEWTIPAKSRIAVAINPTPIPEAERSQEDNIQVQVQGETRKIATISSQSSQPPIVIRDYEERINASEEKRMLRDEMITGKNMTNKEREILFEVIKKEEATFREKLTEEIRSDSLPKYSIKLKEDATPHIAAMGRLSPDKEDMLDTEISDLWKRGLIEYSDGTWRARVVLVKKKDGKWRRCIDYRVLNEMTIADSYPMVRIDETLDQLGKAKYFSKLDMVEGYYQIPLHENSKTYTGFATRSGFYQWKYLPMGFKNAGAAFQRQMDTVLGNMRFKFCIPYIDDIIIYSQTFEEHIEHLKQVFEQFRKFGLFVKMSKCEF
ncbi:MAG TPA: reverse transcriptase domain-containing protein, partial [Candidatus Limnocylindrales bacterium]|nr:reverse transcriptase domain-containing protein [Candidatus Limnocylindrales bacterium]